MQKVEIVKDNESITVDCWFAIGTAALGFKVEVLNNENDVFISRYVKLTTDCIFNSNDSFACLVNTSFSVQELMVDGFGNFTIMVYDWEREGNVTEVYSREFAIPITYTVHQTTTQKYNTTNSPKISPPVSRSSEFNESDMFQTELGIT